VNESLPDGCRLYALANCSDGLGNSYGSHMNVLVTRQAWEDIFVEKPHYLAYLAAFQISSIVFTGQGKVGSERGRPPADFQLSQRADFMETLTSMDTMVHRGVLNTRHEPHCGQPGRPAARALSRLHAIFFDSTLCQVATLLRAGTLQLVLALVEAGHVDARLALDEPLHALGHWSRDPTLAARARLAGGARLTAVELQWKIFEAAARWAARGLFAGIVPEADRLLALWGDTLARLEARDFDALSRRLDWAAKQRLLAGVLDRRPDLTWQSPAIKQLDQLYGSLDDRDGPFWALERSGQVEAVIGPDDVRRAEQEPPADTRAWTRAHLLRLAGDERVDRVDWDVVVVRGADRRVPIWQAHAVHLPLPFGSTRCANAQHFGDGASIESVLEALAAEEVAAVPARWSPGVWMVPTGGVS
jgi:proteasome accessory factor A